MLKCTGSMDEADIKLIAQPREGQAFGAVGEEKRATILFADIRGFTTFAEKQLPYDVIHVLNRYFDAMRQVIERHGGYIDNYMGDGLLALFGVHDTAVNSAEQATPGRGWACCKPWTTCNLTWSAPITNG